MTERTSLHAKLENNYISQADLNLLADLKLVQSFPTEQETRNIDFGTPFDADAYTNYFLHHVDVVKHACIAKQAFLDANPYVKPRQRSPFHYCGRYYRTGRSCHWDTNCKELYKGDEWFDYYDHTEDWKAYPQQHAVFVVSHPYNKPEHGNPGLPDDVECVWFPKRYSWYNPGEEGMIKTYLAILARSDIIRHLDLDYDVPEINWTS